jgi:hypothetical protein
MKIARTLMLCILVLTGMVALPGCATNRQDVYDPSVHEDIKRAQKQPSPTEDMTWVERTGYYVGWFSLFCLYAYAGNNPTIPTGR